MLFNHTKLTIINNALLTPLFNNDDDDVIYKTHGKKTVVGSHKRKQGFTLVGFVQCLAVT